MPYREEPEIVHLSQEEYDAYAAINKKLRDYATQAEHPPAEKETGTKAKRKQKCCAMASKYFLSARCPTKQDLLDHDVEKNFRKYLPYLIFCLEIYKDDEFEEDEDEYKGLEYIRELMSEYLDIVDNEDKEPIKRITPAAWRKASLKKRCEILDPLVAYYGWNEFESFVKDLKWQKFMASYEYTQKDYNEGKECTALREDLLAIWNKLQNL